MTTILLDCDGVIADFTTSVLKIINKKLKLKKEKRLVANDVVKWDICDGLGVPHLSSEVFQEVGKKGFCKKIKPYDDAKEGILNLQTLGNVFIVTSPMNSPTWMFERTQWLETHFGIKKTNIIHAYSKHLIQGDVFIDDKTENVIDWVNHNDNGLALLWDAPYNRDAKWSYHCSQIIRVTSWNDVFERIIEFKST